MTKISGNFKYLLLIAFMLMCSPQKALAFGFLPPLPPDVVIDGPGDAGKVASQIQAMLRQLETYKSQLNSLNLAKLKGELMNEAFAIMKPKSVGRAEAKAVNIGGTSIEKGSVSETDYFDAYSKLFFVYPPVPAGGRITSTVMKTAYKHKAKEYNQDIIIDTYVTGRVTEDYLALVEKTVERLGRCQDGSDTSNCKFFGMEFAEIPSMSANSSAEPGNDQGQLGVATNSYIITTMYDRLLRIIEDLTATEAIYRAAKQNDLVRPISPDGPQSSAEKYIGEKYQFAYHQINSNNYALLSNFKASDCAKDSSKPGCSAASHDKAELNNMESAEILGKLQQIDQWQQEAMILHNLRVMLPTYKSQYRKYLKAKEVHQMTLQALKKSDECAKTFLNSYKDPSATQNDPDLVWDINRWNNVSDYDYNKLVAANNQYKDRTGLSAALITDYEAIVNETIIGNDNGCSGYYKQCPSGYTIKYKTESDGTENPVLCTDDSNNVYKDSDGSVYYACTKQTVTLDSGDLEDNPENAANLDSREFLQNNTEEEKISVEGRIKSERNWRIGRDRLMKLTEDHKLKFKPWNDQKNMQASYLQRKYKNIKTIIDSTDDAFNSFKIAAARVTDMVDSKQYAAADEMIKGGMNKLVKAASRCISPANVSDDMIRETGFCNGAYIDSAHPCPANVVRDVNGGFVKASKTTTRYLKDNKYVYPSTSVTWTQVVSTDKTKCSFTREETAFNQETLPQTSSNCPKAWNLTPSFLIKHYFGEVGKMGGCRADLDSQATNMRNIAKNNGRIVAWDMLADVIDKRNENENTIKAFVRKYNNEQEARKSTVTYYQNQLNNINVQIDKVTKIKNAARKLNTKAEQRIEAIDDEISYLEKQKTDDQAQQCSNDVQIFKLKYEQAALRGTTVAWKTPASCNNVRAKKDKNFDLDTKEVAGLNINNYITTFDASYDRNTDQFISSKDNKHVKPAETKEIMNAQKVLIDNYKITREEINRKIEEAEAAITQAATNFASPTSVKNNGEELSYIVVATDMQEALDEANNKYEKFVSGELRMQRTREYECHHPLFGARVCRPRSPSETDNLEVTMKQYIYGKDLEDAVRQGLNDTWTGNEKLLGVVASLNTNMHIPSVFKVDESFADLGIAAGPVSTIEVVKKIRDKIVEYATKEIADKIKWSDAVISSERRAAVGQVDSMILNPLGLNEEKVSGVNLATISEHSYYAENALINKKHNQLIDGLRKPQDSYAFRFVNGDMSSIWGIPESLYKEGQYRDQEYFIAKPARGRTYLNNNGVILTDANAGRDFLAPQEPLLNLPPLREVFYFSSLDYDDMPRNGDVPTITNFLQPKYSNLTALGIDDAEASKWEYLPQVWLYLLARPNTRNDGKYQQTFVEDSYGDGTIKDLIKDSNDGYRALIGRSGVYPCKLDSYSSVYKYIDVAGGDGVGNMKYYKRKTLPAGINEVDCMEIEAKNGITHKMADHGETTDNQKSLSSTDISAYDSYSELGQIFRFDGNKLKYRALQKNIQEFLLDNKNTENNINRRKAEAASFKRNVFGSFLEMVEYEHNAKKNVDAAEKNIRDTLNGLCSQIHQQKMTVGAGDSLDNTDKCVSIIMNNGGLASSSADRAYGESGEYDKVDKVDVYSGVSRSSNKYYDRIYYLLADKEASLLNNAMYGATASAPEKGQNPVMCGTIKNRHCGYQDVISQFSQLEQNRVRERLNAIVQYFNAFNGDKKGIVQLSPDTIGNLPTTLLSEQTAQNNMKEQVNNARADRTATCESDDKGIQSMENQGKSVPYCPVYIKK